MESWFFTRLYILGPLFFLIYINDLPQGLISDVNLFADDTSLFSIDNCAKASASVLDSDLLKIQNWAYQWRISFNPDRAKQAQEVIRFCIGLLPKLQPILRCRSLLITEKSLIRPHLEYGVIYDQPSNAVFSNKTESVQYNEALALTGATNGSSRVKLYQKLGLEYLQQK